jgi:hypothetical protein
MDLGKLGQSRDKWSLNELDKVGQCKQVGQWMISGCWTMDEHGELDN